MDKPDGEYDEINEPLGVSFVGRTEVGEKGQWLECKTKLDLLIDDFESPANTPGKKWFDTVDLLICDQVDDQRTGYELEVIDKDNRSDC